MKRIFCLYFLLVSIGASAQSDTSQIKIIEPPDSTAIGVPDGILSSREIGPAGGTIVAEDGRVELIFPAGALTDNTKISIQPTTNFAPNGTGKAYQFEPSGIQFKKPVQIIFHYTDDEAETCPPELMSIAMQDHNGKWSFISYEDWDSTAKILKGFILHFSGVSNVYNLKFDVVKPYLFVGDSTEIDIVDISRKLKVPKYDLTFEIGTFKDNKAPLLWYVNGFENGNPTVGRISKTPYYPIGNNKKYVACVYNAPQYMLPKPVKIWLDVYVFSGKAKVYKRKGQITCKITIYDEYDILVRKQGPFILDCDAELNDGSVISVVLYPDKVEFEVKNFPPKITKKPTCPGLEYTAKDSKGPIDLDKLNFEKNKYKITDEFPPTITMEFLPKTVKIMDRTDKRKEWKEVGKHPNQVEGHPNIGNIIKFTANRTSYTKILYEDEDDKDEENSYELSIFPQKP